MDFYEKEEIVKNSIYVPCRDWDKINGDDKHDISYTIDPRKAIMHSNNPQTLRGMGYEEFARDVKDSGPYSDLKECTHELSKTFEIEISNDQSTQKQLQMIANELLVKRDIHLKFSYSSYWERKLYSRGKDRDLLKCLLCGRWLL